jgi:hypoxanthine-DNA glycosylase
MVSAFVPSKRKFILSSILLLKADSLALTLGPKCCNNKNSIGNTNISNRKRKYVSDGLDVLESFAAIEGDPLYVHTLILGTLPSDKSYGQNLSSKDILLRGGDGHQNYGNSRNSFWNIIGSAFGFQRHQTPFEEQVRLLTDQGYSVWDVLSEAKRKGSLDSNLVKGSLTPTDLPGFILDHPNLNRLVFAANSAEVFCKKEVWADWLATGEAKTNITATSTDNVENLDDQSCEVTVKTKFWIQGSMLNLETFARTNTIFGKKKAVETVDDPVVSRSYSKLCTIFEDDDGSGEKSDLNRRVIELIVVPSTSPANARIRPPEKEKKWHMTCYRLQEPPQPYACPGCEYHVRTAPSLTSSNYKPGKHWFHDCPYREDWKISKKEQSKKKSKQQASTKDDGIDPFYWYM